jgi:hypothetical protein
MIWAKERKRATGSWPGVEPKGLQDWHKYAARNGGAGMWVDLPVHVCAEKTHKDEVNRLERL